MEKQVLNNLKYLTALRSYNPEKRQVIDELIKYQLTHIGQIVQLNQIKPITPTNSSEMFSELLSAVQTDITLDEVHIYCRDRFLLANQNWNKAFKEKYNFDPAALLLASLRILEHTGHHSKEFPQYKYEKKEDKYNPIFVAQPSNLFLDSWMKTTEITQNIFQNEKKEIRADLIAALDSWSFKLGDEINLLTKPILKIDEKYVILVPTNLFFGLIWKYEGMFRPCQTYSDTKGRVFENIICSRLNEHKYTFEKNIQCKKENNEDLSDIDVLLKLKNSNWVCQIKSRPPDIRDLTAHRNSISNDFEKGVEYAIEQGEKTIEYLRSKQQKVDGLIIILDGIYPCLNKNQINELLNYRPNFRMCILNVFDLSYILNRANTDEFEEFLLWRTQEAAQYFCFNEKDGFQHFVNIKNNSSHKKALEVAKEKGITAIYIPKRDEHAQ